MSGRRNRGRPAVDPVFRFLMNVPTQGDGCWVWSGSKDRNGYGKFSVKGRDVKSHRFMFEFVNTNTDISSLCVCHSCDNPSCVNPAHLFAGTHSDNALDRDRKGRVCHGIKHHSAKLTERDVSEIRSQVAIGSLSLNGAARRYGVRLWAVQQIVSRNTWKRVP